MTNPSLNESVPADLFTEATPRQRAAYARLEAGVKAFQENPDADADDLSRRLAALKSDEFGKVMQATTTASRPLPPSPSHISQQDISDALGSELSQYSPNLTTGAPVTK